LTGFGALLKAIAEREHASDSQTEAPPEEAPVQSDRLEVANARWSAHALELRIRAQTPGGVTSFQGDPTSTSLASFSNEILGKFAALRPGCIIHGEIDYGEYLP
jgi:hypothetical protein